MNGNLSEIGLSGYAVEPNAAMRAEAAKNAWGEVFTWSEGYAETTGLEDNCVNWALMGSSFHWADSKLAVKESSIGFLYRAVSLLQYGTQGILRAASCIRKSKMSFIRKCRQ